MQRHTARHSAKDAECSNKTIGTVSRMPWQWSSMWCIFSLSLLTYKLNLLHTIQWAWTGSTSCWACVIVFGLCLFKSAWLGFSSLTFIQPELAHISEEKWPRASPWVVLEKRNKGKETELLTEHKIIIVCLTRHWILYFQNTIH